MTRVRGTLPMTVQVERTQKRWKALRLGSWSGMIVGAIAFFGGAPLFGVLLGGFSAVAWIVARVGAYWTTG